MYQITFIQEITFVVSILLIALSFSPIVLSIDINNPQEKSHILEISWISIPEDQHILTLTDDQYIELKQTQIDIEKAFRNKESRTKITVLIQHYFAYLHGLQITSGYTPVHDLIELPLWTNAPPFALVILNITGDYSIYKASSIVLYKLMLLRFIFHIRAINIIHNFWYRWGGYGPPPPGLWSLIQKRITFSLNIVHSYIQTYQNTMKSRTVFGGLKYIEAKSSNQLFTMDWFGGPQYFIDGEVELKGFFGVKTQLDDGNPQFMGLSIIAVNNENIINFPYIEN